MSDKKDDPKDNNSISPRNKSPAGLFMTPSSPPTFVSFEDLMKASTSVANMALAHEIAIDSDFKLQKFEPPSTSIEGRIKETMMTAFWDVLREQITASPPKYDQALNLLKEVRDEIKGLLLPNQERIKHQIDEQLDMELIKQQLSQGAFNLGSYAGFIIDMMGKLCAPVRDDDIARLRAIEEPVELYREIFRVLDLMKMDMANFTISQMRPYIQQQSVIYEKKKFQEYLDTQIKANIDGLVATKEWLRCSHQTASDGASSESMSPSILLCQAYIRLLDWPANAVFPECCVMDEARFLVMGEALRRLVLVSTLILVASSYYSISPEPAILKEAIKAHCLVLIADTASCAFGYKADSLADQIVTDIRRDIQKHEISFAEERLSEMRNALVQSVSREHRVHALLHDRMQEFLLNVLLSQHREPLQIPQGLSSAVQTEMNQLIGQLLRIVSHNRNVFGNYYDNIIQAITFAKDKPNT